jgi:hypothetical protein
MNWLQRRWEPLEFARLTDREQDQYMELVNKIDTKLLSKFLRTLPLRAGSILITGGAFAPVSAVIWLVRYGSNQSAKDTVKSYVMGRRWRHWRFYVNVNSFPSAHVAFGGKPLQNPNPRMKCPVCKTYSLQRVVVSARREVLRCYNCNKCTAITFRRHTLQPEDIIIPGYAVISVASAISVADGLSTVDFGGTAVDILTAILDALLCRDPTAPSQPSRQRRPANRHAYERTRSHARLSLEVQTGRPHTAHMPMSPSFAHSPQLKHAHTGLEGSCLTYAPRTSASRPHSGQAWSGDSSPSATMSCQLIRRTVSM